MDIARELLVAAEDLVEAGRIRRDVHQDDNSMLVTATEMEQYCPDCARKIAAGEMRITRGELREMLDDYGVLRVSESKKAYSRLVLSEPFKVGQTTWRIAVDPEIGTWRAEWRQGINWQDQADWHGRIPTLVGRKGSKFLDEQIGKTASVSDRVAARWETLPEGWTDESREKFWNSLTGDVKHKISACMRQMEGKVSDPGAFCGALARQVGYEP